MHRRDFLTAGAASATIAAGATPVWRAHDSTQFSRAQFRGWLNHNFHVTAHGALRASPATLVAVEDGPAHPRLEQFRVLFRGAASLPTGMCWLSHADGAQFALYLEAAPCATNESLRRATFGLLERRHV
jgi:hypothetical protein